MIGSHRLLLLVATLGHVLTAQAEEAEGEVAPVPSSQIRYVELKPTFVANYGVSDNGRLRYIKADITVRVDDINGEYATKYHLAALRNSLVLLLSRQDESTVSSAAGRETIKAEALAELREILHAEEGEGHIEELMFTNFVVQR